MTSQSKNLQQALSYVSNHPAEALHTIRKLQLAAFLGIFHPRMSRKRVHALLRSDRENP